LPYVKETEKNKAAYSSDAYIPERDIYVDWTEDLE